MTWWQRQVYRLLKIPFPPTDAAAGIPVAGEATDIAALRDEQEEQAKALTLALLRYRRANMTRAIEEHNDA